MTALVVQQPGCFSSIVMHNSATRRCTVCPLFSECAVAVVAARVKLDAMMAACPWPAPTKRRRKSKGPAKVEPDEFEIILPGTIAAVPAPEPTLEAKLAPLICKAPPARENNTDTESRASERRMRAMVFLRDAKRLQPALTPSKFEPELALEPKSEPIAPRLASPGTSTSTHRAANDESRSVNPERYAKQPHRVFDSPQHNGLRLQTQAVIGFANRRFNGRNNGAIFIKASALRELGFTLSDEALAAGIDEAVNAGFFVVTRERCGKRCALYGLSWIALPGESKPRDTWATIAPKVKTKTRKTKPAALTSITKAA